MNTDATINIGSAHSICQDYVIARSGYVILSDGCSSSPDTDIGARLLVKALDQLLKNPTDVEALHKRAARVALDWAGMIALPPQSVDATLMSIHVTNEDLIIACSGDGVIILESQAGVFEVYAISSPSGYPFYASYAHQPERLSELITNDRHTNRRTRNVSRRCLRQALLATRRRSTRLPARSESRHYRVRTRTQ